MDSEHTLADARMELESLFGGALRSRGAEPELIRLRQAALSTLQLQRACEDLLAQTERSIERHLLLSPAGEAWQITSADEATIRALHALLAEGIADLIDTLRTAKVPDIDHARAREIELNALEMASRSALLSDGESSEEARVVALRLNATDLVNAYETVGNHLYRLSEALAAEVDQDHDGAHIGPP